MASTKYDFFVGMRVRVNSHGCAITGRKSGTEGVVVHIDSYIRVDFADQKSVAMYPNELDIINYKELI